MIASTQEKREELAKFAKATLNSLNGIEPENPNQYDGCLSEYTQKCMEIALASLTAEPFGYVDEDAVKDRDRLFSAQVFADEEDLPSYEFSELSYPLYLAPPVPEIKLPSMELIKEVFLANGFKEKTQPDGTVDLNPYVYDATLALIKRLNGLGE